MIFPGSPSLVHIVGRKRSGKTQLIVKLIQALSAKGYRVAGVRHSPHAHSLDSPGADTEAFKKAGAAGSALISANETDIFFPAAGWEEKISPIMRTFYPCHLILVEGGVQKGREKIEIVTPGEPALCAHDPDLRAVISTSDTIQGIACFAPDDIEALCAFVEQRYIRPAISGAVLAGGKSSRLGANKAFLKITGKTVIERVLATITNLVASVRIITNSPEEYRHLALAIDTDIRPGCGPLSGIHSALSRSDTEYVLVASCDLPLLTLETVQPLLSEYPGYDITMYKHTFYEPLCAVYRRTCLPALEELIDHGECRILDLFPTLAVKIIRIEKVDAFQGINTIEDYQQILKKCEGTD